ncbi:MAG: translation initiation factor IF-2 [Candidatus Omnitrophica bacterium]|nr:translation initiation factor IF-2 [Candidatus Omnitrophota bacterium]
MSVRVHILAKELGLSSKDLIQKLKALKVRVKGHMSAIEEETVEIIRLELKGSVPKKVKGKKKQTKKPKATEEKIAPEKVTEKEEEKVEEKIEAKPEPKEEKKVSLKPLELELPVTIKQLSVRLGIKPSTLISSLMKKNIFATINQNMEGPLASEIAALYGYEIIKSKTLEEELTKEYEEVGRVKLKHVPRFPVVTFMGHVDHGKTSLLDYIRKTKVVAGEKGGITQHIGAYKVSINKGSVTFLDTPGHEAFTAMRARGASATDIVVLVVAANDGVMPQTKEAIDHARAANVPIVVAINKCDLPNINLDKARRQLSEQGLISEDWGGKTIMVPVSAKTGEGVDKLLEMLLLEAELLELKANPNIHVRGVVIEGKLSPGQGVVATILVKHGTLKTGDTILSGLYYGKIKAMIDDRGRRVTEAPPSTPVEILGLSGMPEAGDEFFVVKDEKKARTLSLLKQEEKRQKGLRGSQRVSLEHFYEQIKAGEVKELKIILKADVQGSVEALTKSLEALSTDEVKLKVTHLGVGNISESDIMLALVAEAVVIGFHVKIDPKADEISKKERVDVKRYDIIYEAVNDVKAAMEGLLEPTVKEVMQGRAKIQQVFKVSKIGFVAGSIVVKGSISRPNPVRLLRGGKEIYKGRIRSLKKFKDDAKDVSEGVECGIALEGQNDIKPGDIIESFVVEKVARRLDKKRKK